MFKPAKRLHKTSAKTITDDHQRLITLINSMTDGVLALDNQGLIQLTNAAALELLDSNSLEGKNIDQALKLVDSKDQRILISELLAAKKPTNKALRIEYSDGSRLDLDINVAPVLGGFGTSSDGFVLLLRDITVEKSLDEERDEFISVASHELRTPIAIAEGNIGNAMLLARQKGLSDTIIQALEATHQQIVFLGGLVNDLSMLSRAERKDLPLNPTNININRLVAEIGDSYSDQAEEKGLNLIVSSGTGNITLFSNELYVKEILQNLVSNSLKYTDKGTVKIAAQAGNDGVEFLVKDSGFGIAKSDQSKLFEKFYRSDDARVQQVSGTGLGLYVSAKLIKLLGGAIAVDSQLNQGSSFKLWLPNLH